MNTSPGAVIDTAALLEALHSGRLAAVGLNLYEDEPNMPAVLRDLPNRVLLPHVGSATAATRDAVVRFCAENAIALLDGGQSPAAVV